MKDSNNRDKVTVNKRKFILFLVLIVSFSVFLIASGPLSSSLLPLSPIKLKPVRAQQQPSSTPQQPTSQPSSRPQQPSSQSQQPSSSSAPNSATVPPGNSGNNPYSGPPGQTGNNPGQSGNTQGQSGQKPCTWPGGCCPNNSDSECQLGKICESGLCVEGCRSDSQCPRSDPFCVPNSETPGKNICSECRTDSDCHGSNMVCHNTICLKKPCKNDNECSLGNVCDRISGQCIPACTSDADCDSKLTCVKGHCEFLTCSMGGSSSNGAGATTSNQVSSAGTQAQGTKGLVCKGQCVDPSDPAHCGSCIDKCGSNEICTFSNFFNTFSCQQCPSGQTACSNSCVDTQTNQDNCGSCGHPCATGETCQSGLCQQECSTDQSSTCGDGVFHDWLYNGGNSFTSPYVPECTGGQTVTSLLVIASGDYSVLWTQLSGPLVQLSDPTSLNPTFTAPEVQQKTTLTFQLTATVGGSLTGVITYYVDILPKC